MDDKQKEDDVILFEKVFDAGANTIWEEMKKLRGQAPERKNNIRKRWVWELIQNASDCIEENNNVNINICSKEDILEFSHDGLPFSYKNLVDLITQISSKQSDEEKTGKFGTGFISTHLLSEKVKITGFLKQDEDGYKPLNILIDRSGESYEEVRSQIKIAFNTIQELKNKGDISIKKPNEFRTTFSYENCSSQETKEAIDVGLKDLRDTVPFVLAFNQSIESIRCNEIEYKRTKVISEQDSCYNIIEISDSLGHSTNVLVAENNQVNIAMLVQLIDSSNRYRILSFPEGIPKLFCNFPLIGTEKFSFPVIINSAKLEVEKDRNAIHEGYRENIEIIKCAIKLYEEILSNATHKSWGDLFNICGLNKSGESELQKQINKAVKKRYEYISIVDVNLYGNYKGRESIKVDNPSTQEPPINQIYIPYIEKQELQDDFWELINNLSCVHIPIKETYIQWSKIISTQINLALINEWWIKEKEMVVFENVFRGTMIDRFSWLNKYNNLWIANKGKENFINEAYVLNQNNKFVRASEVYTDKDIDDTLKNILNDLGENIREKLLAPQIIISEEVINKFNTTEDIAKKIENKVTQILSDETLSNTKRSAENQIIFNKITNWFLENPKVSETLFENLYNKRNLLSTIEENIRRYKIAEKIECSNIKYEQLDGIIENHEKIAELIDNIDTLSNEQIKDKLKHISVSSGYGREKFEEMLNRTVEQVHKYLMDLPHTYEIESTIEKWVSEQYSETVFPVQKEGKDIRIIIRPSDGNKLIFINDEEIEALDDTDYELWTDNGQGVTRMITLGDIIRTTGITTIPLRNIFNN